MLMWSVTFFKKPLQVSVLALKYVPDLQARIFARNSTLPWRVRKYNLERRMAIHNPWGRFISLSVECQIKI